MHISTIEDKIAKNGISAAQVFTQMKQQIQSKSPVESVVIGIVSDFVNAYEQEKFRVIHEGGNLLSVSCFMRDYCGKLRKDKK